MIDVTEFRTAHTEDWSPADAPTKHCAGAMARVKAPLLRRRFAALTRAMRSRWMGIYRSVGESRLGRFLMLRDALYCPALHVTVGQMLSLHCFQGGDL